MCLVPPILLLYLRLVVNFWMAALYTWWHCYGSRSTSSSRVFLLRRRGLPSTSSRRSFFSAVASPQFSYQDSIVHYFHSSRSTCVKCCFFIVVFLRVAFNLCVATLFHGRGIPLLYAHLLRFWHFLSVEWSGIPTQRELVCRLPFAAFLLQ